MLVWFLAFFFNACRFFCGDIMIFLSNIIICIICCWCIRLPLGVICMRGDQWFAGDRSDVGVCRMAHGQAGALFSCVVYPHVCNVHLCSPAHITLRSLVLWYLDDITIFALNHLDVMFTCVTIPEILCSTWYLELLLQALLSEHTV